VEAGTRRARACAESMIDIFTTGRERNDTEWNPTEMKRQLLEPLGLNRKRHAEDSA